MSVELEMLVWVSTLTLFMWFPYIVSAIMRDGITVSLKRQGDERPPSPWAERAKRAHYNAIENLVPFAILTLVAHVANISNDATQSAAVAYFGLRAAHYVFYVLGISVLRTVTFSGGWLAQICILYQILNLGLDLGL